MIDEPTYTIRQVASPEELGTVFEFLGRQFTPPLTQDNRLCHDLKAHFAEDRALMLVAEKDGRVVGGVLGFASTLQIIAVVPEERSKGLGRRLVQVFEVAAMRGGLNMISLGALEEAKGFYVSLGYYGKHAMHKELPLPGRVRELRLKKLEAMIGDLEAGHRFQADGAGKIPALF